MSQTFFDRHRYVPELLPLINTEESEISPAIINDDLYFSAVRQEQRSNQRNLSFYDVYYTETDLKGYPLILRKLVPGFGNLYHEGPISWCGKTEELFVTLSNISGEDILRNTIKNEHIRLRLVIMKQVNERWTVVEELPFNNNAYHFAHPAISKTGDTLVFTSDMAGGFGKSDLYMSIRKEGKWSDPQNLGEVINTGGNEMFPTFGPGGLLLFSSDGHAENHGQLDLYYTTLTENASVRNLGSKINSEQDDFGLVVHPSGEYGYFSSSRIGAGKDDIYRVSFISLFETLGGVVVNNNGEPESGALVNLLDCNGNDIRSTQSDSRGFFEFEVFKDSCYQAMAMKTGYHADLKPYYLRKSIELVITQLIRYNILVVDIENSRPLADGIIWCDDVKWMTNENGNADIDTDKLKQCDLRITKEGYFDFIIEADPYRFTPGAEILDTVFLFRKEINKSYVFENINFFLDRWRLLPDSEQELRKLIKLMNDNPNLKIELASHTDSRGEAKYNEWLSQKRSDSVTDYLIENGISKERIVSKGYGESRLINNCANGIPCSEAEHLENRRTEFIVIDF